MAVPVRTDLPHWQKTNRCWHAEEVLETIACGFPSVQLLIFLAENPIPLMHLAWFPAGLLRYSNNVVGTSGTGLF